jgi:hypothetical protein
VKPIYSRERIIIIIIITITITTTTMICQHEDIILLWNQGVQTDREVLENRPDIIIENKTDKICLLIDVAVQSDRNVIQKESEKKVNTKI